MKTSLYSAGSLVRVLALGCSLATCAAQAQSVVAGPAGAVDLADRGSTGQVLRSFQNGFTGSGSVDGRIPVGSAPAFTDAFGEPTFAAAHADDHGIFWVEGRADNPFQPDDAGNPLAFTNLLYRLRKDSPSAGFSLNISEGQLFLADFGSATLPLRARVEINADVLSADGLTLYSRFAGFAEISGHGGIPALATYDFSSMGLSVTDADFFLGHESPPGTTITDALLAIPASTVNLDLSAAPAGAQFLVNITATALAFNQPGENIAFAYLRDPLKFDDADPTAGASGVVFSGVTVLPAVPEPATAAMFAAGLLVLLHLCGGRQRRATTAGLFRGRGRML
jgi:hypothetical protein